MFYAKLLFVADLPSLDRIDRRILLALDHNARIPISDLSRQLKLGRDIVAYRVERLTREGVIEKFVATVNPSKIGLSIYKTYLRLNADRAHTNSLLRALKSNRHVLWHARCDGAWDLMIGLIARDSSEAYELQRELLGPYGDLIIASIDSVLVETHVYRKNYLLEERIPSFFTLGGSPTPLLLEPIELRLLEILSRDARASLTELSAQLDTTVDVVRNRIERLETSGIITGYRVELNLSKVGMIFVKAMLSLRHRTLSEEEDLENFCAKTKRVAYFIRQLGAYPIELELEVENYARFYQIMEELKERFPGLVKNIESIFLREETYRWSLN